MTCARRDKRVVEYSPLDMFSYIITPAWCETYGGYESSSDHEEEEKE